MEVESEHSWLKRYAEAGDEPAFHTLVRRHLGLVLGTAYRITESHAVAEEVAQDVFALLAARAKALARGGAPLAAWLHRTARYKALRARKSEQRRRRNLDQYMNEADANPARADEWDAALPFLDAALDSLSAADRELVLLHYYERLPHPEIAGRLGISPVAARQRSSRAVERLAKAMRARGAKGVTAVLLATGAAVSLVGNAPAALAAGVSKGALAAAPAITKSAIFLNLLHTMKFAKTSAVAASILCLAAVGWQEASLANTRSEISALKEAKPDLLSDRGSTKGSKAGPASATSAPALAWERAIEDLKAGRLTPEALAEFARRAKRSEIDGDLTAQQGLQEFVDNFTDDLKKQAMLMCPDLDISPREKRILSTNLGYLAPKFPVEVLAMATRVWRDLPENDREFISAFAVTAIANWAKQDATAAQKWFASELATGRLSPGFAHQEPKWTLGGALLNALVESDPGSASAFLSSISPEDQMATLTASASYAKSGGALQKLHEFAKQLPENERLEPSVSIAARYALWTNFDEAQKVLAELSFANPAERNAAAVQVAAVAGAIGEKREKAWTWLSSQAADDVKPLLRAQFLSRISWNDPEWVLQKFVDMGGPRAGDEVVTAFLKNIPGNKGIVLPRYFDLAAQLPDSPRREDILGWAVHHWKTHDSGAARQALNAAALPADLKERVWTARD